MAILERAGIGDFERVYPLLLEFNNPRLKKEDLRRLFIKHWQNQEDYFGYMLVDSGKVVGFLGYISNARIINNKLQKFCNLGSWIVKKEYRSQAILLLLPALKLEEYTVTDFTPSKEAYLTLKKLGFKDAETNIRIILPVPAINSLSRSCSVEFDRGIIKGQLNKKDLEIYHDHLKFKNIYLLIVSGNESCYVIVNRTRRKGLFFGRLHYVNNMAVFLKYINRVSARICLRLGVCGLLIDEQYPGCAGIRYSVKIKRRYPSLFKSKSLGRDAIDTLYSELLVLDL